MTEEKKAQFILNIAKELVISGKFPIPRKEIIISNISLIPKIETKYEPLEERQKAFISGFTTLVNSLYELYESISKSES